MQEITFIGNLTGDPELRYTNTGKSVCNFSVAVNRSRKGPDGNAVVDYFDVAAWNHYAETCSHFLHKGSKVFIRGELQPSLYEGKHGPRLRLYVQSSVIEFLTPRERAE